MTGEFVDEDELFDSLEIEIESEFKPCTIPTRFCVTSLNAVAVVRLSM